MTAWPKSAAALLDDFRGPAAPADMAAQAADRVRRAARLDCPAAALRTLARDPEIIVRATVALNGGCDPDVDAILASDEDERIRALLAGRIARLLPNLDAADRTVAADHVNATLTLLATDEATRVRAAIADEVATMDAAPRDLVLQLARDVAREVSDQIVRLSPVLSDADLLSILATPHAQHTAQSIASREKLSSAVADVIVQQADAPTIRALLHNQSACIREATLDALVGRAPNHIDWHAPLVRRPSLSTHAVRALSEFIAFDLLRVLATRVDLEPGKLDIVRQRLAAVQTDCDASLIAKARQHQEAGTLTEAILRDAATAGDTRLLLALLAVSSRVSLPTIDRILELRSAKALVSLVWRSGFTMAIAVSIQEVLSHFGPNTTIYPTESGDFPLSRDEMGWQIELLGDPNSVSA